MNKLKDVKIHDTLSTNMGGIRISTGLVSEGSIDSGSVNKCVGLDANGQPVSGDTVGGSVSVDEIASGSATAGQVLTADGDGGAEWAAIPAPSNEVLAYEGTSLLPSGVVFEDWTLHRAIKDGNILWIICNGKITNTTDSSATVDNVFEITLPTDISSKIYRRDGTTCNNSSSGDINIVSHPGCLIDNVVTYKLLSEYANKIKLQRFGGSGSVSAGGSLHLFARIPIFLDIGTVQS